MGSCGSMHDLPHEQLSTINFGELQFTYFEQTSLKDFNDYWHWRLTYIINKLNGTKRKKSTESKRN